MAAPIRRFSATTAVDNKPEREGTKPNPWFYAFVLRSDKTETGNSCFPSVRRYVDFNPFGGCGAIGIFGPNEQMMRSDGGVEFLNGYYYGRFAAIPRGQWRKQKRRYQLYQLMVRLFRERLLITSWSYKTSGAILSHQKPNSLDSLSLSHHSSFCRGLWMGWRPPPPPPLRLLPVVFRQPDRPPCPFVPFTTFSSGHILFPSLIGSSGRGVHQHQQQ